MSSKLGVGRGRDNAVLAAAIAILSLFTVGGAWAFQWAGYVPCELCLKERIPHYAGIVLAVVVAALAAGRRRSLLAAGFLALVLVYGAGAALAGYHAGVEWGLWPGPSSCTGAYAAPAEVGDFLKQLQTASVVRCDAAALHVLGLSLAAWDGVICVILTAAALRGLLATARVYPG